MSDLKERPRNVDLRKLAEKTPEERQALAEKARKVFQDDQILQQSALILRDARRLYTVGRTALSRRMAELEQSDEYEAVIVEAMNKAALAEFTRDELADSLQRLVMPFIAFELAAEKSREKAVDDERAAAQEKARIAQKVDIGLSIPAFGAKLERGTVHILCGARAPLKFLIDRVATYVPTVSASRRIACVRLLETMKEHTVVSRFEKEVLDIGVNRWTCCADTYNSLSRFLAGWMKQTYKSRLDLLLIDDIPEMTREIVDGYPRERRAAAALRILRRWADENGCAVLAALPVEEEVLPDPGQAADGGWGSLYEYAKVVEVSIDGGVLYARVPGGSPEQIAFSSDPPVVAEKDNDHGAGANSGRVYDEVAAELPGPAVADETGRAAGEA